MSSQKYSANLGYKHGFQHGYNKGYNDGFDTGYDAAIHDRQVPFTGTSIIIPTYNKIHYLQQCIESIVAHTNTPYEIIVIDNGSTDSTVSYLKSLSGHIQIKLNPENYGFSGAINQGLHLARGTTLLILNNDAIVTENWLNNLLYCLMSDQSVGIVAPVTNYISGEQLIEVHYKDLEVMHEFARSYNRPNSSLWTDTTRLTGFCMLLRRKVFERLGYFDEGFEIGNCEDDDYSLRVRLLGLRLIIAKDTFIHHYGSVSMKELHSHFDAVYEKNLRYYSLKWGEIQTVLKRAKLGATNNLDTKSTDFYPSHVVVKAVDRMTYWLEKGGRYAIENGEEIEAVRLSSIDLECWPLKGSITVEEYRQRFNELCDAQLDGKWQDGVVIKTEGQTFQISGNLLRHIISDHTFDVWFSQRPKALPEMKTTQKYREGRPIVAPIMIKAANI